MSVGVKNVNGAGVNVPNVKTEARLNRFNINSYKMNKKFTHILKFL